MGSSSNVNVLYRPFYAQKTLIEYFNGARLKRYFLPIPKPFPNDDHERKQFYNLEPFQVFSCWNGAAVIDSRVFFASNGTNGVTRGQSGEDDLEDIPEDDLQMHLDPVDPDFDVVRDHPEVDGNVNSSSLVRFRTARNDDSPITEKASECFLICVDLWRRGMGRILMVPRARWVLIKQIFFSRYFMD